MPLDPPELVPERDTEACRPRARKGCVFALDLLGLVVIVLNRAPSLVSQFCRWIARLVRGFCRTAFVERRHVDSCSALCASIPFRECDCCEAQPPIIRTTLAPTILFVLQHLTRKLLPFFFFASGLAVEPNRDDEPPAGSRDAVFGLAQDSGTVEDGEQIRRTITMVHFNVFGEFECVVGGRLIDTRFSFDCFLTVPRWLHRR